MANLNFKGRPFVQNYHLSLNYHQLIPKKNKSLTNKVTLQDNLVIHGDNLKVLKSLLPTYVGKIKCVYIDPPYNTGGDWIYNDNVNSPMIKEWLGKIVEKEDLTRHDKWLCMMLPRLKIIKDLMTEDGVIFVSIDDNELHNLRIILDEIFNESNFLGLITWIKKTKPVNSGNAKYQLQSNIEYVLCYCKNKNAGETYKFELIKQGIRKYNDEGKLGKCRFVDIEDSDHGRKKRETMKFAIMGIKPAPGKRWKIGEEEAKRLIDNDRIQVIDGKIKVAVYPGDEDLEIYSPFWSHLEPKDVGTAEDGKKELTEIMGKELGFDTVKPTSLIQEILRHLTNDVIVLDCFAGSGTTGHSVLNLNQEDKGTRKFILIESENYADKITAERLRRVIKGKTVPGLPGTFSYFEVGKPLDIESMLQGKNMPSYEELARYLFYTATGDEFDESVMDEANNFVGETEKYKIYLYYKPDINFLKENAFTLDSAKSLGEPKGKRRLVFASSKYVSQEMLDELKIDFAQLPFEIYKFAD